MNKENFIQLVESARLHHINLDYSGLKQEERDSLLRLEKDIAKTFADSNEDEMLILCFIENGNKNPIRIVINKDNISENTYSFYDVYDLYYYLRFKNGEDALFAICEYAQEQHFYQDMSVDALYRHLSQNIFDLNNKGKNLGALAVKYEEMRKRYSPYQKQK